MCKSISEVISLRQLANHCVMCVYSPVYEAKKSDFEDKARGFDMTRGKCWTLKITKNDETTPGPVYETQHLNSITRKVE